uniref:Macaca fascicularis brain cDNA clone: QflA-17940, similar to human SPPL2b (SPPL2B), mRNA, RefSeq: NM_152988.1 n=1 Tax=Macaca fascicularis TaxID=9541 RepID=I7GMQ9_MACFA|nr:unnamed protein product [Macaca fascicularis]
MGCGALNQEGRLPGFPRLRHIAPESCPHPSGQCLSEAMTTQGAAPRRRAILRLLGIGAAPPVAGLPLRVMPRFSVVPAACGGPASCFCGS